MPHALVLYEGIIQSFVTEHAVRFVTSTGSEVTALSKAVAPIDTGLLEWSIRALPATVSGMKATVRVGSDVYYAEAVHEGHRAVIERAKPGGVLYLGVAGFATVVHHPGAGPRRYLTNPLERIGGRLGFVVTRVHEP